MNLVSAPSDAHGSDISLESVESGHLSDLFASDSSVSSQSSKADADGLEQDLDLNPDLDKGQAEQTVFFLFFLQD